MLLTMYRARWRKQQRVADAIKATTTTMLSQQQLNYLNAAHLITFLHRIITTTELIFIKRLLSPVKFLNSNFYLLCSDCHLAKLTQISGIIMIATITIAIILILLHLLWFQKSHKTPLIILTLTLSLNRTFKSKT